MTRKDYIAIAKVLAATRPDDNVKYTVWADIVTQLSDVLQADNPRFDRMRFQYAATEPRKGSR